MKKKTVKLIFLMLGIFIIVSFSQNLNKNVDKYVKIPDLESDMVGVENYSNRDDNGISIEEDVSKLVSPITSLVIGQNVTNIGDLAFAYNTLTSVTLGEGVTNIGDFAFAYNTLTSVIIPNNVTTIGASAFTDNALTSVTLGEGITNIEDGAFSNNALTSISIPNNVTNIGYFAFGSNALTSVTLGEGVTNIASVAFFNNENLEEVIVKATIPATITSDSFGTRTNIDLIVPEGTKNAYLSAGWTGFKSVTEDSPLGIGDITLNAKDVSILITDNLLSVRAGTSQLLHYSIYSMSGVPVLSGKQDTISIAQLSSGVYIAVLTFDSGVISKKFAK